MNDDKTLTVITTTYNRAYCLHQVYESLLRQTSDDFIWLIIDDGSTDNTKEIVQGWKDEGRVQIEYFFKPNGGMHTARNLAYEKAHTELNVIIDSDDWMTDDGVELITSFWKKNRSEQFYGIISHNIDTKGKIIGSSFPENINAAKHRDLIEKYHLSGDKKLILRSALSRQFPYPEFQGEKFYPASYKFRKLDQNYDLLILNKATCVVDYNNDSMTYDKFAQYKANSKGFAHYRNEMISMSSSPTYIIKDMIHYITESRMAGNKHYIVNSAKPFYAVLCYIPGRLYGIYLNHTKRKY